MKILFLTRLFFPHIGGVERHVFQLSQQLIKKGHQVTIITESLQDIPTKPYETIKNMHIYRIPYWPDSKTKKFKIWQWMWQHRKLIQQADIIHAHDVFFWYLPFRILLPQKPIYTTFHGYESYPITENAKTMHKIAEQLSWGNICIGDFIPKHYHTKPTIISYGAVKLSSPPVKGRTLGARLLDRGKELEGVKNTAVFIGRLDDQTGILTYAQATKLIRKKIPSFKLTVIGDGPYQKDIQQKGIESKGFQSDPEKFLKTSHFAFISRYLAILEAMAQQKLIFAVYDNPIKEDYLKLAPFAKYIIITNSPEELAQKVLYYLKHRKQEQMLVAKAYEWVKKQTWENLTNQYLKLWGNKKGDR